MVKQKPEHASFAESVSANGDPFKAPILGALRDRQFAETTGLSMYNGRRLYLSGDWEQIGRSMEGAEKLKDAVVSCFEARGIELQDCAVIPRPVSDAIIEATDAVLSQRESKKECIIGFDFDSSRNPHAQVQSVLDEIIAASRKFDTSARVL